MRTIPASEMNMTALKSKRLDTVYALLDFWRCKSISSPTSLNIKSWTSEKTKVMERIRQRKRVDASESNTDQYSSFLSEKQLRKVALSLNSARSDSSQRLTD